LPIGKRPGQKRLASAAIEQRDLGEAGRPYVSPQTFKPHSLQ
jgi:hypothetical protein